MKMRVTGTAGALQRFGQMRDAGGRWTGVVVSVGSDLPYASPIEFGRTLAGNWVRKAGPAMYLHGGLEAARQQAKQDLPAAIVGGPGAVGALITTLNRTAQMVAQGIVPVRSGALKGSIRSTPR